MYKAKLRYLERLTPKFATKRLGTKIEGSTPPSVFIGRQNYPKVFVGPLVAEQKGDTTQLDTPEQWIPAGMDAHDVAAFRMQLARGMQAVEITDLDNKIVDKMRDIALSARSIDAHAEFLRQPRGYAFNEEHQPFGPSAPLKSVEISNVRYEKHMEKAYYDTDLPASRAIVGLYEKGLLISQLQKSLSVGAFGIGKQRKLVPTRWSITAVDDIIGKNLLARVKAYPALDSYQVYEFHALNNYFIILLMPTQWQYEFLEVFIRVLGNEELIFSDWEPYQGRKDYAQIGGCYYSTRLAIVEKLHEMGRQSGTIVFRESYPGYVPLGVWLVRETSRAALAREPKIFHDMQSALHYIEGKLRMKFWKYRKQSVLLKQRSIASFM